MKKSVLSKDGLTQLWDSVTALFVRKETGKGLSSNDFTNTLKSKLDGIQEGANVNLIESISVNGTNIGRIGKNIDIPVITEAEIQGIVASAGHLRRAVVEILPDEDIDSDVIYMVKNNVESENDTYIEYMYINDTWEIIGKTDVDLSGYVQKTELEELTDDEIDAICTESATEEV